jgi:hypothetical protein
MIHIHLIRSELQSGDGVGIPSKLYLDTSVPATIYYSLDNTTPSSGSLIYIDGIVIPLPLPNGAVPITLKAFATNGQDVSQINCWEFSDVNPQDYMGDGITPYVPANHSILNYFPFGDASYLPVEYLNNTTGTVSTPNNPNAYYGAFDANGQPSFPSDKLYTEDNYEIVYDMQDSTARFDPQGVGRRPSIADFSNNNITFEINRKPSPTSSKDFAPGYNRDAFVTFQNCDDMTETSSVFYNAAMMTQNDAFATKIASKIYGVNMEVQPPTMFLISQILIASKGILQTTYLDVQNQKYIINKYSMKPSDYNGLTNIGPISGRRNMYVHGSYPSVNSIFPRQKIG